MAGRVLELVVYKLNEGVAREEFLDANGSVATWISRRPGFISRDLAYDADGDRWIDVIWWKTMDEAHAASEAAMTSDSCLPMFAQIEEQSLLMIHAVPAIDTVTAATPVGA